MISVLILTKNEQHDLGGCLKSVAWCDDIHVYDSISNDDTVGIAKNFGAHITQRPFDNWASHQNWGLANIKFKHPWVFYIDADERMTPELAIEIQALVKSSSDNVAYRIQRRDFFMGTWLKHVQTSPYYMRLFRPEKMRYERLVISKGIAHWIERHNSYSFFEAKQIVDNRKNNEAFSIMKAFFEKDFHIKRFHQKELFYRLPMRPLVKFFILYIAKRGFLDGKAGMTYAILQSIYEYFIVLKTREIEAGQNLGK